MLISGVGDAEDSCDEPGSEEVPGHHQEYQTASELFDLMTKNQAFDTNDEDTLTTQDLVLLYQNIDIGTKLMSSANERKKPNQHVETVVYNEDSDSDSDVSLEEISSVFEINQERLNIFTNGSLDNILCHKLGGLQIKTSDLTADYDRQFLFKDPYIKEQLRGLGNFGDLQNVVPTSLLDYICCKRLEDNYNFYMDNIIRYVKRTIEQLKRISNGDYLTERTKERWKEVNGNDNQNNKTKVLANSTSIPLHVECKKKGNAKWDDIIHSEMDVRSLSKILEKKIVLEIPKLICGSYRLFSKRCADNLIISCKRGKEDNKNENESRVDVVLQLKKSETGQVMSNISSIMILQTTTDVQEVCTPRTPEILPLAYNEQHNPELSETDKFDAETYVVETKHSLDNVTENNVALSNDNESLTTEKVIMNEDNSKSEEKSLKISCFLSSDECLPSFQSSCDPNNRYSSESSIHTYDLDEQSLEDNETSLIFTSPDELRVAMQRLNMPTVLPEESGEELSPNRLHKKKSLTRVRIKSPYENKSFMMEERKRKKLLEIREKRERKKQALGDCKISKTKYIKGNVPQPASSVTKLSITNKSFYNSIYGQNMNEGNKSSKPKNKRNYNNIKKETPLALDVAEEQMQDGYESSNLTPDPHNKKYINRSYYLDEAETEMMYIQKKHAENKEMKTGSASTSTVSNDFQSNLNLLTELIGPSDTRVVKVHSVITCRETLDETDKKTIVLKEHSDLKSNKISIKTPTNTPKDDHGSTSERKSLTSTVECRKSIEKVYDLMKKLSKTNTEPQISPSKHMIDNGNLDVAGGSSSDSGTSLKHQLTSSNTSSFSFDKLALVHQKLKISNKKSGQSSPVVPKVIITDKIKINNKKSISPKSSKTLGDNPLKTITQLLNELEKQKHKLTPDKIIKKVDVAPNDSKSLNRGTKEVTFRRKSRIDQHVKQKEQDRNTVLSPRERKVKPRSPEVAKIPHQQTPVDDKLIERITKKKITDIIDEAKEARGEAVRGPPKFPSRLYTLAQPKKVYVQAHNEEYRNRFGRNIMMADRLQRLASTSPVGRKKTDYQSSPSKAKPKRASAEGIGNAKVPVQASGSSRHHSNCNSPKSRSPVPPPVNYRRNVNCNSPKSRSPVRTPVNYRRSGTESPEPRKNKWAIEPYEMNYYNRRSRSPLTNDLKLQGHKSRVPLMPKDIELASLSSPNTEEANEIGNKLHSMINSLVVSASPLEALTESRESHADGTSVMGNRTDSDFNIDVLEDKYLKTAVETCYDSKEVKTEGNTQSLEPQNDVPFLSSKTELEQLENALSSHITGTLQKRLRIKNLTLTPKQSLQKVFLLQSGDAGSLFVKSLTKLNINKCVADGLNDLKAMPVLSNNHLNWNFMEIPMQISTVGYTLTQPTAEPADVDNLNICSIEGSKTTDSSELNHCQCLEIVNQQQLLGQTEETCVKEDATVVEAVIETNVEMNDETKINEVASKETPEHQNKQAQNDVTATKEEHVVLKTTEVARNETNRLPNQCSVATSLSMKSTNPDCTSSLDMLVGLLNEIKKITCENHVSNSCSDLDTMLCNATNVEKMDKCRELVSVSSLDQLKNLGSNASIYSLYISNAEDLRASNYSQDISPNIIKTEVDKPVFVDKDVNVNIEKDFVSAFTDVPSSFFPITMNHSTNMTNSLIGVISEPSSQSMFTFSEYHTLYSNNVFGSRSTKYLEPILNDDSSDASIFTMANENSNKLSTKTIKETTALPARDICDHKFMRYDRSFSEFDPLLKMKRDILVTVYSILVFTVFAALSFPEMLLPN